MGVEDIVAGVIWLAAVAGFIKVSRLLRPRVGRWLVRHGGSDGWRGAFAALQLYGGLCLLWCAVIPIALALEGSAKVAATVPLLVVHWMLTFAAATFGGLASLEERYDDLEHLGATPTAARAIVLTATLVGGLGAGGALLACAIVWVS